MKKKIGCSLIPRRLSKKIKIPKNQEANLKSLNSPNTISITIGSLTCPKICIFPNLFLRFHLMINLMVTELTSKPINWFLIKIPISCCKIKLGAIRMLNYSWKVYTMGLGHILGRMGPCKGSKAWNGSQILKWTKNNHKMRDKIWNNQLLFIIPNGTKKGIKWPVSRGELVLEPNLNK